MQEIFSYLAAHPVMLAVLVCTVLFALVGVWYVVVNVVAHRIQVIVITLVCAAGLGSGCWVIYRGVASSAVDLIAIGIFLIIIFPIIFQQAIGMSQSDTKTPKPLDRDRLARAFGLTANRNKP